MYYEINFSGTIYLGINIHLNANYGEWIKTGTSSLVNFMQMMHIFNSFRTDIMFYQRLNVVENDITRQSIMTYENNDGVCS